MNVLANGYYMHLGRFVKGYQTINLKNPSFCFYAYWSLLTSTFACSFWNILADGIIYALTSLSRIIRQLTLKIRVFVLCMMSLRDYYIRCVRSKNGEIISQALLEDRQCDLRNSSEYFSIHLTVSPTPSSFLIR